MRSCSCSRRRSTAARRRPTSGSTRTTIGRPATSPERSRTRQVLGRVSPARLSPPTFVRVLRRPGVQGFAETIAARRGRFASRSSRTSCSRSVARFFRSTTTNTGRSFPGLTDIPFFGESGNVRRRERRVRKELRRNWSASWLICSKRMRNHSTRRVSCTRRPGAGPAGRPQALVAELSAHSYRVLPDRNGEAAGTASRSVAVGVPDRRRTTTSRRRARRDRRRAAGQAVGRVVFADRRERRRRADRLLRARRAARCRRRRRISTPASSRPS